MFFRQVAAVAAFIGAAVAQTTQGLTITNPSPSSWWVAGSANTLAWTCNTSPYTSYTVVLTNTDPTVLTSALALIANVPNYDCSYTVNQQQSSLAPSTTWTIELANSLNLTDVYATTQFTVKPAGSSYPATSSAAAGTPTGSGASTSSTPASKSGNGAMSNLAPFGLSVAAVMLGLIVA